MLPRGWLVLPEGFSTVSGQDQSCLYSCVSYWIMTKKGKKMLTGRSMISTSEEALIKGFMMKFIQEHTLKLPNTLLQLKRFPKGKKPGARSGLRRKQSSKHTSESTTKASKSQSGHSKKETKSSSAMDTSSSHPSTLILIEEVAKDKDTEDTSVPPPPSPKSAQIQELMAQVYLLQSQKEELEQAKVKVDVEVASMKAKPSYPDINQLTELLITSLKPELSKPFTSHDIASCLPTELKELPSKITELSGEIKELKQHVRDMEIELPEDLVEIPTELETFTSTISIQEKLQTLDSLPSLLYNVTDTLNRFSIVVDNASGATSMHVPSAGQTTTSPAKGEENTKDAGTNLKDKLIDLLGKDVVTQYYTKKLLFDKYHDKILKRKKTPKITICEFLTKKGPITLKIYREDGSDEVISNLKVSDLHSAEWREVLQACRNKIEK
ncbi:hypothetical protein Tco_1321520 [Tanacetum coccineum]